VGRILSDCADGWRLPRLIGGATRLRRRTNGARLRERLPVCPLLKIWVRRATLSMTNGGPSIEHRREGAESHCSHSRPVPLWIVRLSPAGHISCPGGNYRGTSLLNAGDELPPLPAISLPFAQQSGFLPGPITYSDFHPSDRCRSGPCDTSNRQFAWSTSLSASGSVIRLRTRCSDTGSLISCRFRSHSKK
jgi:hypothetical protein